MVNQRSYIPLEIDNFDNPPNNIEIKTGTTYYLTMTAFDYNNSSIILGIEMDETVSIVIRSSGLKAEVK